MSETAASADAPPEPAHATGHANRRKRLLLWFVGGVVILAVLWWLWSFFFGGDSASTDNAYTNVELAQVTPLVGGPVSEVDVVNTQAVRAGQVLLKLDDTDLKLAVQQAEAALAKARRQVRQVVATDASLAGQVDVHAAEANSALADVARAQANLDKASLDERRRAALIGAGAVSGQELSDARNQVRDARAAIVQARARVASAHAAESAAVGARRANQALFDNASIDTNPEVLAAEAKLQQARIDLSRAVIRAPIDGVVDQRKAAVGQRVQAGVPVMVVVPLQRMYVDANFKEGQLSKVRPGQPVTLTSDLYGSGVVFHGRVQGFAGGSGSAFAAIPAQNATGNWIKVVQRLPVRVSLDPKELREHPLRVGLSMHANIDLSNAK